MKQTVKMTKAFGGHAAGDLIDLEPLEAKSYVDAGLALLVEGDPIEAAVSDAVQSYIGAAVKNAVKDELQATTKTINQATVKGVRAITGVSVSDPEHDPKGGFKSLGHFCHDLFKAGPSYAAASETLSAWISKKTPSGGMNEAQLADGMALIPTEFSSKLQMTEMEDSIVAPLAQDMPMQSNTIEIPAVNQKTSAGVFFGGITISREGEAQQMTGTKPKLNQVSLRLTELVGLCYVSNRLMEDSPISIEPMLNSMFGSSISFVKDGDFLTGDGVNKALGVFKCPALVTVAKDANQTATTLTWGNIVNMWAHMYPRCIKRAVWVGNLNVFPQLAQLRLTAGTTVYPLWVPGGDASQSPHGTILGRPLFLTEKLPTLGAKGDLLFCDFSQYLIGRKVNAPETEVASSMHLRFDYNEMAFRWRVRYDGQPWWNSTYTPEVGDALSPFVCVDVRS